MNGFVLVALLLAPLLRTVNTFDVCGSNYWSKHDCSDAQVEYNLPCYWDNTNEQCKTVICADYSNAYQCEDYLHPYGCQWFTLPKSPYGNIELCHSRCLKYVDIVFTIDVSSSIMTETDNNQNTLNYIKTVMRLWWSIQSQLISDYFDLEDETEVSTKTAEFTRFGVIYFAAKALTYLGLEYGLTLEDYISRVETLFNGDYFNYLPFGADDTNIVSAVHEIYNVFHKAESLYFPKNTITTKRLSVLITDGEPTIPEFAISPCADDYHYDELFAVGINGEPIEFFVALIESEGSNFIDENVFECFENRGGTVDPILGYYDLGDAIPGMRTATNICPIITKEPTDAPTNPPTDLPTCSPTDLPTCSPTDKPTHNPTDKPTKEPTDRPTDSPTNHPTDKPTDDPTPKPTGKPTPKPTKAYVMTPKPTNKPTAKPTELYVPPTKKPTELYIPPTNKPTHEPSDRPSDLYIPPTRKPSHQPTDKPSELYVPPTDRPTPKPVNIDVYPGPTNKPSDKPTRWWNDDWKGPKPTKNPVYVNVPVPTQSPTGWWIVNTNPNSKKSKNKKGKGGKGGKRGKTQNGIYGNFRHGH